MIKNIKTILLVAIGIIAIGLSIKCYTIKDCDSADKNIYGGNEFTGMQDVIATTSEDVKDLTVIVNEDIKEQTKIVKIGFGSILLISGLTLIAMGITSPTQKNNIKNYKSSYDKIVGHENQTILSEKGNKLE